MSRIPLVLALAGLMIVPTAAGAASDTSVTVIGTQTALKVSGKKVRFTETLTLGSKTVGSDAISCTRISGSVYSCRGVYTLSNGTISIAGRVNQAKPDNRLNISGGTGSYAGGSGTLSLHDLGKTNRTRETFTFTS